MEKLSLKIDVKKDFQDFNALESYVITKSRQALLRQIGEYLRGLDRVLSGAFRKEHPEYHYQGQVKKKLTCYYGELWVNCRRYRCRGKPDVYPLKAFLPVGGLSQGIEELALDLVTEIPYHRSGRLLERLTGVKVSGKRIWHRVQRRGQEERARIKRECHRIFEEGRDEYPQDCRPVEEVLKDNPTYIEVDGTMVASCEPGKERFEVKLGLIYSQVEAVGRKGRQRLKDKEAYAATEDNEKFEESFYSVCRKQGFDPRNKVEYISDGAGWLRNMAQAVFPSAKKRLDLYHLKKACCRVISDEEWSSLQAVLFEGDLEAFVDTLQVLVMSKAIPPVEQQALLEYVLNNRDSLSYGTGKRNGSGGVEKNIGIYVGRRCKKQGMKWSPEGVNNLLALRTKKLNQLWQHPLGSVTLTR